MVPLLAASCRPPAGPAGLRAACATLQRGTDTFRRVGPTQARRQAPGGDCCGRAGQAGRRRMAGGSGQPAVGGAAAPGPGAGRQSLSGRESPPPGGGKPAREERRCTPGAAAQRILQLPLSGSDSQKGSGRGPPSQGHSSWQGSDSVRLTGGRGSLPVSGNRSTRAVQVTVPWSRSWSRSPPPPARASLRQ